jgi:hypothetical protein
VNQKSFYEKKATEYKEALENERKQVELLKMTTFEQSN